MLTALPWPSAAEPAAAPACARGRRAYCGGSSRQNSGSAMVDRYQALSASAAFGMLDEGMRRALAAQASVSQPGGANDDHLFRSGDAAGGLFFIAEAARGDAAGAAIQVGFGAAGGLGYQLFEGELVGDVEFLLAGLRADLPPRIASARALRPLTVIELPAELVVRALNESERFRRSFVKAASGRLSAVLSGQADRRSKNPEALFAAALLALLDERGYRVANKGVFPASPKQQELAERLGIGRRLLSLRLSDWSARGLVETVPLALPDLARVERIARLAEDGPLPAIRDGIEDVEAMIGRGLAAAAAQAAADLEALFPGNPVLLYLMALASARMGARSQAREILAGPSLAWDGSMSGLRERLRRSWTRSFSGRQAAEDEELDRSLRELFDRRLPMLSIDIAALDARLAKDRLEGLEPGSDEFKRAALDAAARYRQVHEASPNHFCAVNAAALYLVGGEPDEARELAQAAARLAGREDDYWAAASRAEAALIAGKDAAAAFGEAIARDDADSAKRGATRRQLRLMARAGIAAAEAAAESLHPGDAVFFSGPLMTAKDGTGETLRLAEERMRADISGWLAANRVAVAYASAACGADIVFAEAVIAAGIPLNIVLPFTVERFCDLSVRIGAGGDWEKRYYACLQDAANVTELWKEPVARQALDHHFLNANRHLAGEAILAARMLDTRPRMLAMLDRRVTASLAGTRHIVGEFQALGHEVAVLASPFERPQPPSPPRSGGPFAAMVFAFPRSQAENEAAGALFAAAGFATRMMKDKRLAAHRLCAGFDEAEAAASLLARRGAEADVPLRVICDHGPVLGSRSGEADMDAVLALEAAGDLTAVAAGGVFATRAFAMPALAAGGDPSRYSPINLAFAGGDRAETPLLSGARQVFRLGAE